MSKLDVPHIWLLEANKYDTCQNCGCNTGKLFAIDTEWITSCSLWCPACLQLLFIAISNALQPSFKDAISKCKYCDDDFEAYCEKVKDLDKENF